MKLFIFNNIFKINSNLGGEMKKIRKERSAFAGLLAFILLVGGIISSLFLGVDEAQAIPTFARKYQTSCTTCHTGFPKLNAFGNAFKNNGYRLPDDEVFVKEPPVWLGSKAYKRVWPKAVWPGSIPSNVPISMRLVSDFNYDQSKSTASGVGKTSFDFPQEIAFNSLGTLGDNLSFNVGIAFQDAAERMDIERVFLTYNNVLSGMFGIPEGLINIRGGYFDPMAIPFSPHNQFMTASRPSIYTFRISSDSQPRVRDSQSGIEIYGTIKDRSRYAVGVLNGRSVDGAGENFADNNTEKDFYVRLEHKFGGLSFTGKSDSGGSDQLASGFSYFDQGSSVTVGTTGYLGFNQIDAATDTDSQFYRLMSFLRANKNRYNVDMVYLYQLDDAAAGQFNGTVDKDITTWGFYVEGTVYIYPWISVVARYDRLNIESVSVLGASNPADNTSRLALSVPMYARPNVRVIPEASIGLSDKDGNLSDNFKLRVDFSY